MGQKWRFEFCFCNFLLFANFRKNLIDSIGMENIYPQPNNKAERSYFILQIDKEFNDYELAKLREENWKKKWKIEVKL